MGPAILLLFVLSALLLASLGLHARRQSKARPAPQLTAMLSAFADESGAQLRATVTNIDESSHTILDVRLLFSAPNRRDPHAEIQVLSVGFSVPFALEAPQLLKQGESMVIPFAGTPDFGALVAEGDVAIVILASTGEVVAEDRSFRNVVLDVLDAREPKAKARIKRALLVPNDS